jgi:hypothetical protein
MQTSILHPAACLLGALLPLAAHATTATGLGSFEGIEEPLVRYAPATGIFRPDAFVNITDLGSGTFRMFLRYRYDEWDADRDTPNKDRQRAEVKGLGVHQRDGETFDYETTWRTNAGWRPGGRFCHLFQLKSTDGDSGAPLVTISLLAGPGRAVVEYWSGAAKGPTVAREFVWKPDAWQTVRLRIKTSRAGNSMVLASIDGDEFQGVRDVAVFRPDATDYRPKWGLYRGTAAGLPYGDDYMEHRNISATRSSAIDPGEGRLDAAARELALKSPGKAIDWLLTQPASPARTDVVATIAADWAAKQPAGAMARVVTLAPAEGRADAMLRVFNRWADRDATAALRWATARAPDAELDPLLWYFATDTTLRYVARAQALAGAMLMSDPAWRARALEHVVLIWARREPAAAALYVQNCPALSAAQQAAIRAKIK